jgi:hypothetical protein
MVSRHIRTDVRNVSPYHDRSALDRISGLSARRHGYSSLIPTRSVLELRPISGLVKETRIYTRRRAGFVPTEHPFTYLSTHPPTYLPTHARLTPHAQPSTHLST